MKKRKNAFENMKRIDESKNLQRTLIFTIFFCVLATSIIVWIQLYGESKIVSKCSYLDPMTIDFLAFLAAVFLVIEGFARILEHPNASMKRQTTRIVRIVFGCTIIAIHVIQFLHK